MSSSDDDDTNSTKTEILNSTDTRTVTQVLDSDSPPTSPEIDSTIPLNDTVPIEEVTQVLEEIIRGEIADSDDGEGTDRTELLSENEEGTDDEFEKGTQLIDDSATGSGKKTALSAESHGSGSAHRNFASVRVASLRASGLAAAHKMNSSVTDIEARSVQGNNQSEKDIVRRDDKVSVTRDAASNGMEGREDDKDYGLAPRSFMSVRAESLRSVGLAAARKRTHAGNDSEANSVQGNSLSVKEVVHKDNGVSGIRNPASNGIQGREDDKEPGGLKCNGTREGSSDEIKSRVARSTVRRLFTEDAPDSDNSLPEFDSNDHEFAGLTYVQSQEPGELSQANALNIVDQLIFVNDEELPQETDLGSAVKRNSPPVSNSKGSQMLAQRIKLRSPVREPGIFDWDDSHEDEGGGCFFSKRKEELLGGSCHVQRSYNQPKNSRLENGSHGRGTLDKVSEKEEDLKLRQKMMALTRSDSRLMVHNSKKDEKIQRAPKSRSRKHICKELDAQVNPNTSKHLAAPGTGKESLNIDKVCIDHQTAAEAIEVLDRGVSATNGNDVAFQAPPNDTKGCARIRNKARSEQVSLRRRTSDSGGMLRRSKRLKTLDTSSSGETFRRNSTGQKLKGLVADSATKGKDKKANDRKQANTGTAANEDKTSERRSVKSIDQVNMVSAMNKSHMNEANRCQRPSTLKGNSSFSKGQMEENHKMSTPVARRTRKSLSVKPSNISELSCNDNGGSTVDVVDIRDKKKRRRSLGVDAPKPSNIEGRGCKLPSDQSGSIRKDESVQLEPSDIGSHEKIAKTSHERRDTHRYPQRKRTHQNISNDINEVDIADGPSTAQGIESTGQSVRDQKKLKIDVPSTVNGIEANGKSLTKQKGLEVNGRTNGVPQKRITRSSVHCNPLLSSEKNSEGSLTRQVLEPDLNEAAVNHLDVSPSGKVIGQAFTRQKKLKVDVRDNHVKLDQKRITRSSVHCNPSLSSEKKSEGRQLLLEPDLPETSIKCSVMNEKLVPKNNNGDSLSRCIDKEFSKDITSPSNSVDANARLEVSPAMKGKPSGTPCVTPSTNCTTPINAASPVCVGNGYLKQSCKKSLSRSPLSRELNRLEANEVLHSLASKDLRKRKDMANVRVLFSRHLDGDMIRQQKKILVRLGASIASSSSEATHFVTDKFVRTRNMLEAVASGKPVVTHLWLESCGQANCFIDEKNYILRDLKKEKEIGFSMPVSLARARQSPLLESKKVYITPNVKPSKEIIACLVKALHGQTVERLGRSATKDDKVPDDLLVLSCEEDYAMCVPLLEKGALVYGSELLLNGVVIQKLEFGRHRLFTDHIRKTRSTLWLRKGDGDQFHPVPKRK